MLFHTHSVTHIEIVSWGWLRARTVHAVCFSTTSSHLRSAVKHPFVPVFVVARFEGCIFFFWVLHYLFFFCSTFSRTAAPTFKSRRSNDCRWCRLFRLSTNSKSWWVDTLRSRSQRQEEGLLSAFEFVASQVPPCEIALDVSPTHRLSDIVTAEKFISDFQKYGGFLGVCWCLPMSENQK